MRKVFLIYFFSIVASICWGKKFLPHSDFEQQAIESYINASDYNLLSLQLAVDPRVCNDKYEAAKVSYEQLIGELKVKKDKYNDDSRFLEWMFYRVHRKILKRYKQYSTVYSTISEGSYDCLSATGLYALILNDLGYMPNIIETEYHIYLMVSVNSERYLLESTDPLEGFTKGESRIAAKLKDFDQVDLNSAEYDFKSVNASGVVSLDQIVGLHYFNQAVVAFNKFDYHQTLALLEKASIFYPSSRIAEFGVLLTQRIRFDNSYELAEKKEAMQRISAFINYADPIASNN